MNFQLQKKEKSAIQKNKMMFKKRVNFSVFLTSSNYISLSVSCGMASEKYSFNPYYLSGSLGTN